MMDAFFFPPGGLGSFPGVCDILMVDGFNGVEVDQVAELDKPDTDELTLPTTFFVGVKANEEEGVLLVGGD